MEKTSANQYSISSKPKVPMYMVAIVVTLVVLVSLLLIRMIQIQHEKDVYQEEVNFVNEEKVKLEKELNGLIVTYDSIKTDNDSINQQLAAQQDYIQNLLKQKASNVYKIRKYQEELGTLRKIMRSYIVQIDSLNTRNKQLTAENTKLTQKITRVEKEFEKVTEEREELSSTVKLAQQLSANEIVGTGLKSRSGKEGKPMNKINRIDILRVCFVVRENRVAEAGNKEVY